MTDVQYNLEFSCGEAVDLSRMQFVDRLLLVHVEVLSEYDDDGDDGQQATATFRSVLGMSSGPTRSGY